MCVCVWLLLEKGPEGGGGGGVGLGVCSMYHMARRPGMVASKVVTSNIQHPKSSRPSQWP